MVPRMTVLFYFLESQLDQIDLVSCSRLGFFPDEVRQLTQIAIRVALSLLILHGYGRMAV